MAIAVAHAPNFLPGTAARYSNTDYTIAGLLIERATSRSVADEVQEADHRAARAPPDVDA